MTQPPAHELRLPILWGDMDALGHLNNTVYFRYMEQARIGWFETVVDREAQWKTLGMVIASTSCEFKRAIVYPGTVVIRLFLDRPGGASLGTRYEIWREGDGAPSALGQAMIVFTDPATQKPMRIPQALREKISQ